MVATLAGKAGKRYIFCFILAEIAGFFCVCVNSPFPILLDVVLICVQMFLEGGGGGCKPPRIILGFGKTLTQRNVISSTLKWGLVSLVEAEIIIANRFLKCSFFKLYSKKDPSDQCRICFSNLNRKSEATIIAYE